MSVTPRGMSIQEAYRLYRDGMFLVNRRYQRKLVWTLEEKRSLIDSIVRAYPIPLILLAEHDSGNGKKRFEIVDGIQRLNAVLTFIETAFDLSEKYFDLSEFTRAKQAAEAGLFEPVGEDTPKLDAKTCADILDYQFAVTVYPAESEEDVTEVFGRINAGGRQLSNQERRQAGVTTRFADAVRSLACELRGDVSDSVLDLAQMPEISINMRRTALGYGIEAEQTIWCKQGILSPRQLRDSDDEDLLADIAASILLREPIARSKELLDELYDTSGDKCQQLDVALTAYTRERLATHLKGVFSILQQIVEHFDPDTNALRRCVSGSAPTSIKTPFYTIFMALYELIVLEEKSPSDSEAIMSALDGLAPKLATARHYTTTDDRRKNIGMTKGLIERYFVRKEPPDLGHGPGLRIDFENSLRRSKIETPRYEFKQGMLRLDETRDPDPELPTALAETMCAIANLGPTSRGFLHIGVADKPEDAQRVKNVDGIEPKEVSGRYVVGLDREAELRGVRLDEYIQWIAAQVEATELSAPLKNDVLGKFDTIEYEGLSVLRIEIPPQVTVSFVGQNCFTREGSSTVEVTGPKLIDVANRFGGSN